MSEPGIDERERLRAAGSLIGVPVTVVEDGAWEFDGARVQVGLGWYARRGHGRDAAVSLALLQLWESVRAERTAPGRARRRLSMQAARPELEPILALVTRLQAAAEMLAALPGLREGLVAAMRHDLPERIAEEPRHLQWVALLLHAWIAGGSPPLPDDAAPEVAAEWEGIVSRAVGAGLDDPLRRVLAPDPDRSPLERFERALALLLPPYERLLARDLLDTGLGEAEPARASSEGEGALEEFGAGSADAWEDPGDDSTNGGESSPQKDDDLARAEREGTAREEDLYATSRDEFMNAALAVPGQAEDALAAASKLRLDEPMGGDGVLRDASVDAGGMATAPEEYRARASDLADAIDRMREVWERVLTERVARVRTIGRRAVPEGELLHAEALASAVAESHAGVSHPAAYARREMRSRRRQRAGSTDYVLLIDRSASMQGIVAEAAADAVLIMLEALAGAERDIAHAEQETGIDLQLEIRTALVLFDSDASLLKPLSSGLDDAVRRGMHAGIRSPGGSTNDGAALREAARQLGVVPGSRARGDGLERRRIVLLVSDGGSNDPEAAARELARLRAAGVRVHGIGIGGDEVVRRYAPDSRRLDDPRGIADAIRVLVESELP